MVPRGRLFSTAGRGAFKTGSRWIVGPAAHPTAFRANRLITTARYSHHCQVRIYVIFVAQAVLGRVGENWRLTRFGVCAAGLPTSKRRA
jgi:hypothetical protein